MTPLELANLIDVTADRVKRQYDASPLVGPETRGWSLGVHFGLTRGAAKIIEASAETSDLELIAAGIDHLASAYMGQLKEPLIFSAKENGYHHGVEHGLKTVSRLLREAVSKTPDFTI